MPMADEMISLLKTILLKSVNKKILKIKKLKINLIINQAIRKCLNKPIILLQFFLKTLLIVYLLIKILQWASHKKYLTGMHVIKKEMH